MTFATPFSPILPQKPGDVLHWGQLQGATTALAISAAAAKCQHLMIVVTPDINTTMRLEQELHFFASAYNQIAIYTFPDWETLPYDSFSPHQDLISQRLLTLHRLPQLKSGILLVAMNTLMTRISPREHINANSFVLKKNDLLDPTALQAQLTQCGYRHVSQVMEHGEFTIRGAIVDVFPMGSKLPYRIELFDNEVESIRTFNPETQRSIEMIDSINLLPAKEFPLTETAITQFRQSWRNKFLGNPANSLIYQGISQGETPPGIEYYLPLFFERTATLFDYLPTQCTIVRYDNLLNHGENFWREIQQRYEQLNYDHTRPILPPQELFLTAEQVFAAMKQFAQIQIHAETLNEKAANINYGTAPLPDLNIDRKATHPLAKLTGFLAQQNNRVLFCAETLGRREALLELLQTQHISPQLFHSWNEFVLSHAPLGLTVAALETGMQMLEPPITLVPEAQLYGQPVMQRRRRGVRVQDPDAIIRDLTELNIGAPIVHIDHGIGRYMGLQIIKTGDQEAEYLTLEYANNAKLYVPVSSLHLIGRYTAGDPDTVILNQLGSKQWEKARRKAAEKIRDVAAELLDVYARRAAKPGTALKFPEAEYASFAASFAFDTTPDQEQAINDVIRDMTSPRPMDRLICGDVGFGKTEVAMRAAFIAAQNHSQVAMLVPTTLLAEQHYETFKDRFAAWPINIAVLSRFHSGKTQTKLLADIAAGKVDIVIGTHKLLQPSIGFKNLGLLIVDEEHRFGVHQKDRIKALRSEVDILTLTATPIPRTLNMSLASIRDLSLITTPPARRLAIKTFVHEYNDALIKEAALREIMRGGQVYFLHNDIATINKTAEKLQTLLPEARINVAHGQMPEQQLSKVMADFYHARFNILVCTTIIESGIDVPTANTIIINRADRFGLAQLHQLRGRVGRSHHQAYAYLLTPQRAAITTDAIKRLDAIASLEDLGAGFVLATHDLEIRGAGELLGEEQSGHIQAVGFSLYMEMLEEAVKALKEGKEPAIDRPLHHGTEIDFHIAALIPETFVPDIHTRLTLYKRIASAQNEEQLRELQVEMIDRFGLLPEQTKNLFRITELKLFAQPLGIRKIDVGKEQARIEFEAHPAISPQKLIKLIQTKQYRLDQQQRLLFPVTVSELEKRIQIVQEILQCIKP